MSEMVHYIITNEMQQLICKWQQPWSEGQGGEAPLKLKHF